MANPVEVSPHEAERRPETYESIDRARGVVLDSQATPCKLVPFTGYRPEHWLELTTLTRGLGFLKKRDLMTFLAFWTRIHKIMYKAWTGHHTVVRWSIWRGQYSTSQS